MAERTVRVILTGDASQLVAAANSARFALRELGNTNTSGATRGLRDTGQAATGAARETSTAMGQIRGAIMSQVAIGNIAAMGVIGAFRAIKGAITDTLQIGMDYQNTLLNLGAVTRSSGDVMVQVAAKARELGRDITIPGASAADAARAMNELAKGGMNVSNAMVAAKGTLQLAAAAGLDAGRAAEIQVNAMNAFRLSADQAGHVADVLVNTASAASGEVSDFAFGLQAAGATAHSFGISLEDTNAMLGLFAKNSIKGEEGGTLLKTMLVRLATAHGPAAGALKDLGVTAYDSSGNFEGMRAVTVQLAEAQKNMTQEAFNAATGIAFGTRGIKGATIAAFEGAQGWDTMRGAMDRTGSASDIAAAKMSGLWGSFENFKNQLQEIQIQVFSSFAPALTDFVNNTASAFPTIMENAGGAIAGVASKAGEFLSPLIDGVKDLAVRVAPYVMSFATTVKDGIDTALNAVAPFGAKLAELFDNVKNSGVMDALGIALVGVGHAFEGVMNALGPILSVAGGVLDFFSNLPGPVNDVVLALGAAILLKAPLNALFTQMIAGYTRVGVTALAGAAAVRSAGGIMAFSLETAKTAAKGLWAAIGGWPGAIIMGIVGAFTLLSGSFGDTKRTAQSAKDGVDGLIQSLRESKGLIDDNVRASALAAIKAQQWGKDSSNLADYSDRLGVSLTKQVDGIVGVAGATEDMANAYNNARAALQSKLDVENLAAADSHNAGARQRASDLQNEIKILDEQHAAYVQLQGQSAGAKQAAEDETAAVQGAAGAANAATPATAAMAQAQLDFNSAAAGGVDPTTNMNDALKGYKDAANAADTAGQFLWATMEEMAGGQISAEQATRLQAAAVREIGAAFRDHADAVQKVDDAQSKLDLVSSHLGTTLDGQAVSESNLAVTQADVDAATRALADAKDAETTASDKQFDANVKAAQAGLDAAGAAYAHKAALGDLKGATDDAAAATQTARDQFIKAQTDLGMTAEDAGHLADQYHLIPSEVVTNLQAEGFDTAISKAQDLNTKLDALNNKTIHYTAIGTEVYQYQTAPTGPGNANIADHADGGWITKGTGPRTDDVPINASKGEFIVNAASASRNRGLLEAINGGRLGFADGGVVPGAAATGATADVAVSSAVTVPDVAAIQAAWDLIAKAVADAWASVIQPALLALSVQNAATSAEILALRDVSVVPAWDGIGASVSTTTNAVLLPTYDSLNAGTTATGATWQSLLDATVTPVWAGISNAIQVSWAGTVSPVYDMLNAGSNNAGQQFLNLAGTTDNAWQRIGSTISGVYSGNIVPAWDGVQGFSNATGDFFGGVQSGMSAAKDQIVSDLGEITTEINKFFDMVDGKTAGTPGATATASVTPTFADGGLITMGTGPRTDDVHIRASKGEYVVNAASTAKHRDALDAINYGGAFADGGVVGEKISGNIQEKIQAGALAALDAVVTKTLAAFPQTYAGFSGPAPAGARGEFLKAILSKQGTEYVWGAAGPDVFDCSGLMSWGLEQAGVGKGRLTAEGFNSGWPHIPNPKPGDMVTFDTGRLPGQAGHIGAVLDPNAGTMMHTDGAGPARISDFRSRSGLLGFVDPIGGEYTTVPQDDSKGDPPASGQLAAIIKKIQSGGTGAAPAVSYTATGGVEQWRDEVLFSLAFLGESASLANAVLNQVRTESSGNPNAINLTDSNAMKGTPSKGLVQVIDPTFRSYALAPYNQNIWDPISNLIAGENYARHQYGSIAAGMQGHAYDTGGVWPTGTAGWNTTGGNEYVLKPHEWAVAQSAMNHVVNNSGSSSNSGQQGGIHIENLNTNQGGNVVADLNWALSTARLSS